ncbi:ABC transporter substrate-binding protein [Nocardioides yefusunii]|uniref:ABC transporter substrate-binding protein n=1 Tax=Nocardioides yefusunii TaxID=2500546 RepID=A0ABW1QSY6_9ACTN|nr:ABC transporter substrate-binding protein [Nocardioides yefusunii]
MRRPDRRKVSAVLAAGLLLTATACGSDAEESESKGDLPQGEELKIGFFNPKAGPLTQPGATVGAFAAEDYINYELGGIHGRPVKLVECATDHSAETARSCANKFVEEKVVTVLDGYNYKSSSAHEILAAAKIPMVGAIPFDLASGNTADNNVYFSATTTDFLTGSIQAFAKDGAKSLTLVAADTESGRGLIEGFAKNIGKAAGVEVNGLYISEQNFNIDSAAATIKETNPDVAGMMAVQNPNQCTQLVQGLRQNGYEGTILTAACTEYIKQAPTESEGSALYSSHWLATAKDFAPDEKKTEIEAAEKAINAEVKENGGVADYYAYGQFAATVTLANALEAGSADALTGEGILTTLKALKDFDSFLGPKITCDGNPMYAACSNEILVFEVDGDGRTEPLGGGWTDVDRTITDKLLIAAAQAAAKG